MVLGIYQLCFQDLYYAELAAPQHPSYRLLPLTWVSCLNIDQHSNPFPGSATLTEDTSNVFCKLVGKEENAKVLPVYTKPWQALRMHAAA